MEKIIVVIIVAVLLIIGVFSVRPSSKNLNTEYSKPIEAHSTAEVIGGDNTKAIDYPTDGVGDTTKVKD